MRQLKITKSITNRDSESLDKYLQDIGKVNLISVEEEVELAQRIRKGDQEALIELLYSFKKGLSSSLREEIIAKGTNPVFIDRIVGYADQMMNVNVSQETLKETTKTLSEDALKAFNEIFDEIIGICKIASSYYQYDTLKKEQFTFSKVIKNMNSVRKIAEPVID